MSVVLFVALATGPAAVRADAERELTSLEEVHHACREAERAPGREVFVVTVEPGWSFGTLDQNGFLAIEPRRNFRAFGGRVELFPARMETIGLVATPARLEELEAARTRGARLRIGFFLGFDEPDRRACVIRSRFAVTIVRMDVAFVELSAPDGSVIAREDTERYRAFLDDPERERVPGNGPRGVFGEASTPTGPPPEPWRRALATVGQGDVGRAVAACHREGIARGGERHGLVVVRLRVEGRTGRVLESTAAISDLGDARATACIASALRNLAFSPGSGEWAARIVDLEVPVRLVAD
jgi:hypothetical protein